MRSPHIGQGSNSANLRRYNERLLLQAPRRAGHASKADLARLANLTSTAVGSIITSLNGAKLIVFGEALTDFLREDRQRWRSTPGGSCWNVARVGARLGVPTGFAGTVSHDTFGDELMQQSAHAGLDMRFTRPDAPLASHLRFSASCAAVTCAQQGAYAPRSADVTALLDCGSPSIDHHH